MIDPDDLDNPIEELHKENYVRILNDISAGREISPADEIFKIGFEQERRQNEEITAVLNKVSAQLKDESLQAQKLAESAESAAESEIQRAAANCPENEINKTIEKITADSEKEKAQYQDKTIAVQRRIQLINNLSGMDSAAEKILCSPYCLIGGKEAYWTINSYRAAVIHYTRSRSDGLKIIRNLQIGNLFGMKDGKPILDKMMAKSLIIRYGVLYQMFMYGIRDRSGKLPILYRLIGEKGEAVRAGAYKIADGINSGSNFVTILQGATSQLYNYFDKACDNDFTAENFVDRNELCREFQKTVDKVWGKNYAISAFSYYHNERQLFLAGDKLGVLPFRRKDRPMSVEEALDYREYKLRNGITIHPALMDGNKLEDYVRRKPDNAAAECPDADGGFPFEFTEKMQKARALFGRFLSNIFLEKDADNFQLVIGKGMMTRGRNIRAPFLIGKGGDGKSKLLDVLCAGAKGVFGHLTAEALCRQTHNIAAEVYTYIHENGAPVACIDEVVSDGRRMDIEKDKRFTAAEELISENVQGMAQQSFMPPVFSIRTGNKIPDYDKAMLDRLIFFRCHPLDEKVVKEWDSILNPCSEEILMGAYGWTLEAIKRVGYLNEQPDYSHAGIPADAVNFIGAGDVTDAMYPPEIVDWYETSGGKPIAVAEARKIYKSAGSSLERAQRAGIIAPSKKLIKPNTLYYVTRNMIDGKPVKVLSPTGNPLPDELREKDDNDDNTPPLPPSSPPSSSGGGNHNHGKGFASATGAGGEIQSANSGAGNSFAGDIGGKKSQGMAEGEASAENIDKIAHSQKTAADIAAAGSQNAGAVADMGYIQSSVEKGNKLCSAAIPAVASSKAANTRLDNEVARGGVDNSADEIDISKEKAVENISAHSHPPSILANYSSSKDYSDGYATFGDFVRGMTGASVSERDFPIEKWQKFEKKKYRSLVGDFSVKFFRNQRSGLLKLWAQGGEVKYWREKDYVDPNWHPAGDFSAKLASAGDFDERQEEWAAEAEKRAAKRRKEHEEAVILAAEMMRLSDAASPENGYLKQKGLSAHSALFREIAASGTLVIPCYSGGGVLEGAQKIFNEEGKSDFSGKWIKRPIVGTHMKDAYYIFGDGEPEIIAEGAATAASIYLATGKTTVMAFNCENLVLVTALFAKSLKWIGADNDWQKKDSGIKCARKAAAPYPHLKIVMPPQDIRWKDWNDVMQVMGAEYVKKAFLDAE